MIILLFHIMYKYTIINCKNEVFVTKNIISKL